MSSTPEIPKQFDIAVITERQALTDHAWLTERWNVIGISTVPSELEQTTGVLHPDQPNPIHQSDTTTQYLWQGFTLTLHKDELESYYYNLTATTPYIYVVCYRAEDGHPLQPFLTSLSYDEAAAYVEADEEVFSVTMPPEIYRWVETYVLENYFPEQRQKRKREKWFGESDK